MKTRGQKITKWVLTIILLAAGLFSIYPFIFMLSSTFKPSGDVLATPFQIIPKNFTFMNFDTIFNHAYFDFNQWYINTVVMTVLVLVFKYVVVTMTAYGFSKINYPGRDAIFLVLLAALMIPSDIMILPRYLIFKNLGLLNNMWCLILPSVADVYFVFLLRQAFIQIPDSISEAAKIDGCNHFTIYWKIIMPLAQSSVATMLLFSFVWSWNDYMGPYLYITDIDKSMLSVGIKMFSAGAVQDYGAQMAASTIVLMPIIVAFFACQKFFVEGVTSGAVKG